MTARWRALALVVIGALAAIGARSIAARWLIGDGIGERQRPLASGPAAPAPVRGPVRVVVLDGLSRADAALPALDALCARGVDLAIDVGFPTKSLPVQAVLWTGLTAQQLGLGPTNASRPPPSAALPPRVPQSLAVVEAWTSIAAAMGFATVEPADQADWASPRADPAQVAAWHTRFVDAAARAIGSDRPLVMVHVLAIDRAAHAGGRRSAGYRAAIADADRALARWIAAAPRASWIVLADHGHRARGGHGDAETEVRVVRGCVAPRPPSAAARGDVHLVDVAHHLREVLGVPPHPGAVGRRLATALAARDPDATVPRTSPATWITAAVLALATLLGALALTRRPIALAWWPVAIAAYLAWRGVPSLSARDPVAAVACALALAAPALAWCRRDHRALAAIGVIALGAIAVAAVLAGVPAALVDGRAPARPWVTAALQVVASGGAAVAWAAAAVLALSGHPDGAPTARRARRPGSGRT